MDLPISEKLSIPRTFEKGQSTVEYLLLIGVVISIFFFIFKSTKLKDVLSKNSPYFVQVNKFIEHNYRYANFNREEVEAAELGGGQVNLNFASPTKKTTRFFINAGKYSK